MIGLLSRGVAVCLLTATGVCAVFAQSLPFRHYTPDSDIAPLPSAEVQKVYQDNRGFIWFAVYSSGIARYDGERLALFTEEDGLRDLNVFEIVEDSDGHLWVGSDAGLVVSERPLREYGVAERVSFTDSLNGVPLSGLSIRQNLLVADRNGSVWAALLEGDILRYDRRHPGTPPDTFRVEENHLFQSISVEPSEELLVTGVVQAGGMIWRARPGSGSIDELILMEGDIPSALTRTDSSTVLVGTRSGVLWRMTESDAGFERDRLLDGLAGIVVGILERSSTEIWVATEGDGLIRIVLDDDGHVRGSTSVRGLLSPFVHQITLDREGNLWAAQSGGASRLPHNFDAYESYSAATGVVQSDLVTAVSPPGERSCLWVGTIGGGITCIDAVGRYYTLNEELPTNRVNALVESEDGVVWLGTQDGVLALAPPGVRLPNVRSTARIQITDWHLDHRLARFASFPDGGTRMSFGVHSFSSLGASIEANGIFRAGTSVDSSSTSEVVWFAGSDQVSFFADGAWSIVNEGNGLPSSIFRTAALDDHDMLWIGTLDRGLYRSTEPVTAGMLRSRSRDLQIDLRFEQVWSEDDGAPSNEIEALLVRGGLMWVGTAAGLAALDARMGVHGVTIDERAGLPAPNATSIDMSPVTNTIWVGTNAGLAEIDPVRYEVLRTITKADGLIDNEVCYYGSVRVAVDGAVYYGTCAGLAIYHPHLDQQNELPPEPAFASTSYRETIWGNNEFIAEYAGLSFGNEHQVRYQTRLVGYDEGWSEPTTEGRIRYTNLPAYIFSRDYSFQVRARNESGLWSEAPALVSVTVKPPWWLRWWFVLVFHLAVGTAIYGFIRRKMKQNEAKLAREREINDQLRRVDRMKDEFLANTSHELRTPLNGIIGIVDSLLDGAAGTVTDVMRHNLRTVVTSGQRLASLVDDILDFSKLKEKGLELSLKPVSVGVVAEVALRITAPLLSGKDIMLSNEIDPELPPALADEDRLQQILLNLVGNAVKFTHEGEVRLFAEVRGDFLAVSVSDTGIGIPADRAESVFESFEQADASTGREYGGTGLGLSVTRQLVELHGGEIGFESEVGQGTTFTFTLPVAEGDEAVATVAAAGATIGRLSRLQPAAPSGDGVPPTPSGTVEIGSPGDDDATITVLVVDDEPVNQQVLANHLSNQNFNVVQALNGMQAIEALNADTKFDIVLLDVMMPRMSGYEVCEQIRKRYMPSELPIIMITAKNQVSDLVHGLSVGANDYLAKPFSKDELIARLKTHLNLLHINTSYGRFVPHEFLRYLDKESFLDVTVGDSVEKYMTIFSSDIRAFTTISEGMTPAENFQFINEYMAVAGPVIRFHDGFIDSYIGDAIMALFAEKPDDALDAAVDTFRGLRILNEQRASEGKIPVRIGVGIHYGRLQLGIVGEEERAQPDIISDAVNLTARIEGLTKYYGASVIVTQDAMEALHHPEVYRTRFLADVMVKGKNEPVRLIEMFDGESEEVIELRIRTMPDYEAGLDAYAQRVFMEAAARFDAVLSANPGDKAAAMYAERSKKLAVDGAPRDWSAIERLDFK